MTDVTSPALRYYGAKFRLAPWVIGHFPPHRTYVEPFGGAAGVLLRKPRCYAEVYNDLDGDIVNFFRVLRDPELRERLIELCQFTPFARADFEIAFDPSEDPVERARRTAIRAAMGFGSAGSTKGSCGFRIDTRRNYGTAQHVWSRYPPTLQAIGQRLAGVLIENRPAISVMQQRDSVDTLNYVDPPYMFATRSRAAAQHRYYRHELTDEDHLTLLRALIQLKGMVVLSGYPSEQYNDELRGWQTVSMQARISSNRGTKLRTEQLWLNPMANARLLEAGLGPIT